LSSTCQKYGCKDDSGEDFDGSDEKLLETVRQDNFAINSKI
jgi:hypothetical protein